MDYHGDLRPLDGTLSGSLSDPEQKMSGKLSVPHVAPTPKNVDYETQVYNHPTINAEEVVGHKTGNDYKLQNKMNRITEHDIDVLFYGG